METKYNLDKLIKVTIRGFVESVWYEFKKEKSFLGITVVKEGIYQQSFLGNPFLGMNVPKNHTLKNGIIYENPSTELDYQDDYSKTYWFETYEKAKEFSDQITSIGRWQV